MVTLFLQVSVLEDTDLFTAAELTRRRQGIATVLQVKKVKVEC